MSHERPQRHKGNAEKRAREATWGAEAVGFTSSGFSIKNLYASKLYCPIFVRRSIARSQPDPRPLKSYFSFLSCAVLWGVCNQTRGPLNQTLEFSQSKLSSAQASARFFCASLRVRRLPAKVRVETPVRDTLSTKGTRNHR